PGEIDGAILNRLEDQAETAADHVVRGLQPAAGSVSQILRTARPLEALIAQAGVDLPVITQLQRIENVECLGVQLGADLLPRLIDDWPAPIARRIAEVI